jgi:hypothetical protein
MTSKCWSARYPPPVPLFMWGAGSGPGISYRALSTLAVSYSQGMVGGLQCNCGAAMLILSRLYPRKVSYFRKTEGLTWEVGSMHW